MLLSKSVRVALVPISASLLIAGCGGGGSSAGGKSVSVGVSSLVDLAPIFLGEQKGFFKDVGLSLNIKVQASGSATLAGITSGSLDVGYSNTTSLLIAQGQGLNFRIVCSAAEIGPTAAQDDSGVMVRSDSSIRTAADLDGKTIGVNTLKSGGVLATQLTLKKAGVNLDDVHFVEIPRAGAVQAVVSKRIDALADVEPLPTLAEKSKLRKVIGEWSWAVGLPGASTGVFFTSSKHLASNKNQVDKFRQAMLKSLAYATTHTGEARKVLTAKLKIEPSIAAAVALPQWKGQVGKKFMGMLAQSIKTEGLADKTTDITPLFDSAPSSVVTP